jgi:hypothetical protein
MNLKRLEAGLRRLVESQLMRALPREKPEDRIVRRLNEAMSAGTRIDAAGNRVAPNVYTVRATPSARAHWQDPNVVEMLLQVLKDAGDQAGLRFATPPSIEFAEDPEVGVGDLHVEAVHRSRSLGMTQDVAGHTPAQASITEAPNIPENAFLIVGGVKEYALHAAVVNIGRRLDNDLVIDDPRVSRQHAQLRAINGYFVYFDLESSGGSFINGQRRSQSILYSGDVISLGGVPVIYAQDVSMPAVPAQATGPHEPGGAERPTAIIRPDDPNEDSMP